MATSVKVGRAEIVALSDGEHPLDRGWHFPDVPADAWEPYEDPLGEDALLNFGCFLVRADGRTVLIDTGWGPYLGPPGGLARPAQLPAELAEAGVEPGDIDIVVFTHLHPDHVGWNLDLDGDGPSPRFARARYLVPRLDWEHYNARAEMHPNIRAQALPLAGLEVLDLFDDGHAVTPSLRAVATPGHTPGHTSFALSSAGESCYVLGDLAHHPVIMHETGWVQRFDLDPEAALATRRRVLAELEAAGTLVGAGHFRRPGLGHIVRHDGRRRWRPLEETR